MWFGLVCVCFVLMLFWTDLMCFDAFWFCLVWFDFDVEFDVGFGVVRFDVIWFELMLILRLIWFDLVWFGFDVDLVWFDLGWCDASLSLNLFALVCFGLVWLRFELIVFFFVFELILIRFGFIWFAFDVDLIWCGLICFDIDLDVDVDDGLNWFGLIRVYLIWFDLI